MTEKKKKSKTKATTSSNKKEAPKVTSKSAVAKKTAIKKLKAEVKKAKQETKLATVTKEVSKTNQKKENTIQKVSSFTIKAVNAKNNQNKGKIGEIRGNVIRATGHRKRAIAKVTCKNTGDKISIVVNGLDYKKFFTKLLHQDTVFSPFELLSIKTGFTVDAKVFGGGKTGQADAFKLGLSRCLSLVSEEYEKLLKKNSFLTRDSRKVEPKKSGLKKARKREQFSKR